MTSASGNDLLPVLVQTITSQTFDEANTISQLLHASFHSNKATSITCFDFLAGRALSELVALICDQASKLAAASENSSHHHNHRHHTYDRTGRGHHSSDGINSIKHLVGKLVDIYYNRERVLKTHANLLLEKKHREVGCVLGQMAALYYTQAREMSENIKAILLLKQSSNSSRNGIDASVYDAKTLKGFVRYLAGLYQFRAQFFKRSANELFKSENDSIGTIMSLYGALLADHSGELISLADTGMSERLSHPSVMQSSANETAGGISGGKYFPPMLEGMVNSAISAKGSKSVIMSPPLNSYDDVEEKHETESFSDEAEVAQELAKTGAQDRMTTRVRARDDVSNLAIRYAGANKEEANALHKQLGILNSEGDESLKNGYTIMLKVVEYQGSMLLNRANQSGLSIQSLMLFLYGLYREKANAYKETAQSFHKNDSMTIILKEDSEILESQAEDLYSNSSSTSSREKISKLLVGFYKERATTFRSLKRQLRRDSAAVFMVEKHAEILDDVSALIKV